MDKVPKKTHHEQDKKNMVIKLENFGGGHGGVGVAVLLGIATFAAATALASALIGGRKSQQSELENDQDNVKKELQLILPKTPVSLGNNPSGGVANKDVIEDHSASSDFTENSKLDEKNMPEIINGGTGGPANTSEETSIEIKPGNSSMESNAAEDVTEIVTKLSGGDQIAKGKTEEETSVEEEKDPQKSVKSLRKPWINDLKEEEEEAVKSEQHSYRKRIENLNTSGDVNCHNSNIYKVEFAGTDNRNHSYSSRLRILIGAITALSWFSYIWFFSSSLVKLGLVVFLTMILSKIH